MKVDEASINHNVARLIGDLTVSIYDCLDDSKETDNARIEMLGEIKGITLLAEALKEVLLS